MKVHQRSGKRDASVVGSGSLTVASLIPLYSENVPQGEVS